jgi:hypothetical protein
MSAEQETTGEDGTDQSAELRARLEVFEEENRRLREAYGRVRRTRHRRTALGLAGIGLVALVGAVLFPAARVVLVVLAATGFFGGLLTWYLTPERFVAADVGERVYAALADNEADIAEALGLAEGHRYVPLPNPPDREAALYVAQSGTDDATDPDDLTQPFVVPEDSDHRGLSLRPTGEPLLTELRAATPGDLAGDSVTLVDQLADGLREQFELIDGVRPEVDPGDGRASIAISGSTYGDITRFDHPVASVFATGLAVGLGRTVELEVDRTPDGRGEYIVTARWDSAAADEPAGTHDE